MELRQNSGMDRPAVIQTYGSVWITWVLVWIGGMDRPVGSGYGSGLYILTRSHMHPYIHPSILSIHPSIHTSTYIHASYMHTYMHTTQLVHTQLTRTYSSTHNLLHANPSPSLLYFLLSPCHLYLSFAACWKKLTCGAIRSFNFIMFYSSLHLYDTWIHVSAPKLMPKFRRNAASGFS